MLRILLVLGGYFAMGVLCYVVIGIYSFVRMMWRYDGHWDLLDYALDVGLKEIKAEPRISCLIIAGRCFAWPVFIPWAFARVNYIIDSKMEELIRMVVQESEG